MVQSNMGMNSSSYNTATEYEFIELKPGVTVTNKKIWINNDWEDRKFYRIPNRYTATTELESWCINRWGKSMYQGKWFKMSEHIVLDEQTYVLWILSS